MEMGAAWWKQFVKSDQRSKTKQARDSMKSTIIQLQAIVV